MSLSPSPFSQRWPPRTGGGKMSIKGYPSQQKLGFRQSEFATMQPSGSHRHSLDTVARFAFRVDSQTVPRTAGASTGDLSDSSKGTYVADTSTPALVGDFVRFEDGNAAFLEVPIVEVETNGFYLGSRLGSLAPASGDTFYIMRYVTQRTDDDGTQLVSVNPSPIAFIKNGSDTQVELDTSTPSNSEPLPVRMLDAGGNIFDADTLATEATLASILADTAAMDTNLANIAAEDFATETTLASILADTAAMDTNLSSLASEDFATETTLAALDARIDSIIELHSGQNFAVVGGVTSGSAVRPFQVDTDGQLQVDVVSNALPTGAATEATLASILADTAAMDTNLASIAAEDFATETTLASILADTANMDSNLTSLASEDFATETTLAAFSAKLAADFGASSGSVRTAAQIGNATGAADFGIGAAGSQTLRTVQAGRSVVDDLYHDYSSGNVTTAAYTEVSAATSGEITELEIFDSSGEVMILATGAAASEVDLLYIMPGGNGRIPVRIAAGTRLSIKAKTATASSGQLVINAYA